MLPYVKHPVVQALSTLSLHSALGPPHVSNPLPYYIPARKIMTPTQGAFFGGPIHHSESSVWSAYHSIDNRGAVEDRDDAPDLHDIVPPSVDVSAAIDAAAKFSLAAGKIYLPLDQATFTMSGFWLEGRYFMTRAHFFQRYSFGAEDEERILGNLRTGASRPTFVDSRHISADRGRRCTEMKLVVYNKEADVSIFEILDPHVPSHSSHVRLCDLQAQAISQSMKQDGASGLRIWTAGYCGTNEPLYSSVNGNTSAEEANLRARNPAATEYDLLAVKFRTALRRKQIDKYVNLFPTSNAEDQSPRFEQLYCPNIRAMSVGEILSARTWMQAPSTSLYTFMHPHTISGFYGISGSMICLFQENDIKRPKVIGLFQGDVPDCPVNTFLAFTEHFVASIRQELGIGT